MALIILYTREGKMLLQHRSADAPRYPNIWGCFGGGIEGDEAPEEAVRRECYEEIEYTLHRPKLVDEECVDSGSVVTRYTFIEEYDTAQPLVLHEGQAYGWFTLEEASRLSISARRYAALQRIWPLILGEIKNSES